MADYRCKQCPWESKGWPNKKVADARGKQHATEHETGEPMPELAAFDAEKVK